MGTVNPSRWIGCLDEATWLVDQGVRLFRFFPQHQEWTISQAPFRRLVEKVLAPTGVAMMIPAGVGFTAIGELAAEIPNPVIVESFKYAALAEAAVVMQETPNVYVETHMINSPNWVELLKNEVGVDRIVFGSNAPLSYVSAATAQVVFAAVSPRDKALILGENLRPILDV